MRRYPLTLIEQYLFHEHRNEFPCRVVVEWSFSGTIDKVAFENAVRQLAPRHPLTTATVVSNRFGKRYWETNAYPDIPLHWHQSDSPTFRPELPLLDPSKEQAFELHIVETANAWSIIANLHHSICDGIGIFNCFHELLLAYDATIQLPPPNVSALQSRGKSGITLTQSLRSLPFRIAGFFVGLSLLRRSVAPLNPNHSSTLSTPLPPHSPHIAIAKLDREATAKLQATSHTLSQTINNLCIVALQTAIHRFRSQFDLGVDEDWIRLSIPVNLRTESNRDLPACNVLSMVSIDRRARGLANHPRLLRRAKEDMALVKNHWLSLTFLQILRLKSFLPNSIRNFARIDRSTTTAILTNVGLQYANSPLASAEGKLEVRGSTLESIVTSAPFRPHTHATMMVVTYAGELNLNLTYDPRALSQEQAQTLATLMAEELKGFSSNQSS